MTKAPNRSKKTADKKAETAANDGVSQDQKAKGIRTPMSMLCWLLTCGRRLRKR